MLIFTDGTGQGYELGGGSLLLQVLQALAPKYPDAGIALLTLRTYLDGGSLTASANAAIEAAIGTAATSNAELKSLLDGALGQFLFDRQAGTPPTVVLRTLTGVSAPLTYALQKSAQPTPLKTGDAHLSFGANANAQATVDVLHSGGDGTTLPSLAAGDAMLEFQIGGNLDLQGAYTLPFNGGSLGASANAGAAVKLDALFQWPATSTVIGALAHSVDNLCAPWDLDAVDTHLAPLPAQSSCRGLRQLNLTTTGSLQLAGSIGVGRSFGYTQQGLTRVTDIKATLGLQLALAVGWSRQGNFLFTVQRAAAGGIAVSVRRQDATSSDFGADLTAGLVITGLGQTVQPIVDQAFPDPAGLMAELRKWTAPGTVLVDALEARLPADSPVLTLLGQYLLGTVDLQNAQAQLRQLVSSAIRDQVDAQIPFWSQIGQPDVLAKKLATRFANRIGLETSVAAPLIDALTPKLSAAIGDVHGDFDTAITQIVTAAGNALAATLAPFAAIGQNLDQLVTAVNADASAILAPAITLLTAYEQVRNKVIAAVSAANALKLGLSLKVEYKKSSAASAELDLRIAQITPRTRLVYRALMLGRLDTVWGLLEEAVTAKEIDPPQGAFSNTITRGKEIDFSVYFGNWSVDWQQSTGATAQVSVDANGMIALGSAARFTAHSSAAVFGTSDNASFSGSIDIVAALQNPASALPVTLGFALNYSDQRMQPADLATYVHSLIQRSAPIALLSANAVANALQRYGNAVSNARLDTVVSLDVDALARLLALTQTSEGVQTILRTARVALFGADLDTTNQAVLATIAAAPTTAGLAQLLADIENSGRDADWLSAQYTAKTGVVLPTSGGFETIASRVLADAVRINLTARGLLGALTALYDAKGILAAAVPAGTNATPQEKSAIYAKALDGIDRRVLKGLGNWFVPANWFDVAPAGTVALLSTLAQLSGAPTPLLVPVLQYSEAGQPKVLAF